MYQHSVERNYCAAGEYATVMIHWWLTRKWGHRQEFSTRRNNKRCGKYCVFLFTSNTAPWNCFFMLINYYPPSIRTKGNPCLQSIFYFIQQQQYGRNKRARSDPSFFRYILAVNFFLHNLHFTFIFKFINLYRKSRMGKSTGYSLKTGRIEFCVCVW